MEEHGQDKKETQSLLLLPFLLSFTMLAHPCFHSLHCLLLSPIKLTQNELSLMNSSLLVVLSHAGSLSLHKLPEDQRIEEMKL